MRRFRLAPIFALLMAIGLGMPALAQEPAIGASVDSLLDFAKTRNPEYAAM
ncbi:MAG: outer membrane protein heavy metal efflux system [Pseudomonadota bacterium]|nr:outer membrane protein heavy metal efflux system [Pseudomonadota bacterium]MDQ5945232.1 outer membrane protein heavy metal efflux system [Pseudomonadota bacterium]